MKIDLPPGHRPTLVALPLIFLSLVALAQAPSRTPTEKGRIRVEVNLVNVIASVADKKGRPVPDLPKEEFEIYEEGVRQRIEVFEPETRQGASFRARGCGALHPASGAPGGSPGGLRVLRRSHAAHGVFLRRAVAAVGGAAH